jgi:hypothetical protein
MIESLAGEILGNFADNSKHNIVLEALNRTPVSVIAAILGLPERD